MFNHREREKSLIMLKTKRMLLSLFLSMSNILRAADCLGSITIVRRSIKIIEGEREKGIENVTR